MAKFKKIEKQIIKILLIEKKRMTGYEIGMNMSSKNHKKYLSSSTYVYNILNDLTKRGIVQKINSYPVYYQVNNELKDVLSQDVYLYEVLCPKCNKVRLWVYKHQKTAQCNCITDKGKPYRFWVNSKQFTGERKISV